MKRTALVLICTVLYKSQNNKIISRLLEPLVPRPQYLRMCNVMVTLVFQLAKVFEEASHSHSQWINFIIRELSLLMVGTGVEEFFGQMEKFMYPIHYIQEYVKPHLEMLGKFHTPKILLFVSLNLDLNLTKLKALPGYEGKEHGKEKGNQRNNEHSLKISKIFYS